MKALFDTGCDCEDILISDKVAEKAGLFDKNLNVGSKSFVIEPLVETGSVGLGHVVEDCDLRWGSAKAKKPLNQRIFMPPSFLSSAPSNSAGLKADVIVGLPEIQRWHLDERRWLFGASRPGCRVTKPKANKGRCRLHLALTLDSDSVK